MKRIVVQCLLLGLAACEQPAPQAGKWIIVPTSMAGPIFRGTSGATYFAWRLNTATGDLEACTYEAGSPDKRERLGCTTEIK